jgi:uncharacterized Rmd1/YagE family protein
LPALALQYGTVVFWGISAADEQAVLLTVVNPCKQDPFQLSEVEIDEFTFHYSVYEPPHIQNDIITINRQYAADHQVCLAQWLVVHHGGGNVSRNGQPVAYVSV